MCCGCTKQMHMAGISSEQLACVGVWLWQCTAVQWLLRRPTKVGVGGGNRPSWPVHGTGHGSQTPPCVQPPASGVWQLDQLPLHLLLWVSGWWWRGGGRLVCLPYCLLYVTHAAWEGVAVLRACGQACLPPCC